jgi:superfamily I DNA/RNA helicase
MPRVAISADFLNAFAAIPRAQQRKVREFVTRFQGDPTLASINYEPIVEVRDDRVRTVRIDLAYRAIVLHPQSGDIYVLVWVDHHDEAMAWARNKVFEVNPLTGALQVLDTAIMAGEAVLPAAEEAAPRALRDYALFETFSDDDLLRTGLPRPLLPAIRALKAVEELEALQAYLPEEAFESLYWVANLGYSIDQALAEVSRPAAPAAVDPTDLEAALAQPDSQRRFAFVDSAEELLEILNAPLEKWRIFLHPSQAYLVKRNFNGPARVLGGAGTGKTVVAMHRARHLTRAVFTAPTDRILFTTFTRNLATNIQQNLENLCGLEISRIEVVNLHAWAVRFLRSQGYDLEIARDSDVDGCWQNALAAVDNQGFGEAFFRNEWEHVVQAQDLRSRNDYLRALRRGRGDRLTRPQRAGIWQLFEEFRRQLQQLGKMEWLDVIRETRLYLQQKGNILPYRAIIVDETQDLHPEELRLLRQMAPAGPNDLFFVGDAHQRIYGRPVVLGHCGIDIRGRGHRLRINYRTTEEIRNWATARLLGEAIDDLNGGQDRQDDYRSLMHGLPPEVHLFAARDEEESFLVARLRELLDLAPAEAICLVARTHSQLRDHYIPALRRAQIDHLYLQADTPEYAGSGVRLATMHRVKGLEFPHVLIAGANHDVLPLLRGVGAEDGMELADVEMQERCLLHVAASRARETLAVSSYGSPSPFIC